MTETERKKLYKLQIEQLTSFIDAAYAGLVKNLKITWEYDWDDHNRSRGHMYADKIKADHAKDYGKHTEITLTTPAWYGTMAGDLSEQAYHWREKLVDKLDDDKRAKIAQAMNDEYGPSIDRH